MNVAVISGGNIEAEMLAELRKENHEGLSS